MLVVKVVLLSSIVVLVLSDINFFRPQTIRFYVFDGTCPEYPNALIYYSNVKIMNINRTFYINMKVHIKEDIKSDDLQLVLDLKRCQSRDALDCESYKTMKLNNFCKLMTGDNKPWSSFRSRFKPPMPSCPLTKGTYEVKNGTFDVTKFPHIPISNVYWKVKVNLLTTEQEVVMCNKIEGQIAPA